MLSCFLPVHDALNGPYSHLFLSLFLSVNLYTCYAMPLLIDFAKTWSRHVCPMCSSHQNSSHSSHQHNSHCSHKSVQRKRKEIPSSLTMIERITQKQLKESAHGCVLYLWVKTFQKSQFLSLPTPSTIKKGCNKESYKNYRHEQHNAWAHLYGS